MARKIDMIEELYRRYSNLIVSAPENWEIFLNTACRNYKLDFSEQILVYAQKPTATAILEIEKWNKSFGRWVNRGATGIAVFEKLDNDRQRLKYYFDISDTHAGRDSRPVLLWEMRKEYEDEVITTLENMFGTLPDKSSLGNAVLSSAQIAVEDNIENYSDNLVRSLTDSFLEDVDELNVREIFKGLVTNSVSYMLMKRLGIEPKEYFTDDDFRAVVNFNTSETLNTLGLASSDIAMMGLSEIAKTIGAYERQNRTFERNEILSYNEDRKTNERKIEDGRDRIQDAGRLPSSRPETSSTAGGNLREIRSDAQEVPSGREEASLLHTSHTGEAGSLSSRSGGESLNLRGNSGEGNGIEGRRDGETERDRHDELGKENEQHQKQSAGNSEAGSDLRLEVYDWHNEDLSLPFFGKDSDINEILLTTPHLKTTKNEIKAFLEGKPSEEERTKYIKSIFNNDYTELVLSDGRRVGYKTMENVLHLWEGSYLQRTAQSHFNWSVIGAHFEGLRLLGKLYDDIKPLPSIEGQLNILENNAEEKSSAFTFSQEIIDTVLTKGSNVSEGKMRIYEQFQKSLSSKENADFLKNEYGWGGTYPIITGTGIDESHDGKGIKLSLGLKDGSPSILLPWKQVAKRIDELIKCDRYLNPKEQEIYPQWLTEREQRRAANLEEARNRAILAEAPKAPKEYILDYHLGDKAYIGSSEYEIIAIEKDHITLFDTQFPLFNKEMERQDFESKIKENPLNDHLKVEVAPAFIDKFYTVEDLEVRGALEVKYYDTLNAALDAYKNLPGDKKKALGIMNTKPLPGSLDFIHCIDGKDTIISDYEEVDGWQNDEIKSVLNSIKDFIREPNDEHTEWNSYNSIKEENPNRLVLYEVESFFESYGEDARVIADALKLQLSRRNIPDTGSVSMCGIPSNRLGPYMDMLLDRGHDLVISEIDDGVRNNSNIDSIHKDHPSDTFPVGRIEYLGSDGNVGESIEYTDAAKMQKDLEDETYYGVPMSVVLYKDKDGNTIPHNFIYDLDPPVKSLEKLDNPFLPKSLAERVTDLLKHTTYFDRNYQLLPYTSEEEKLSEVKKDLGSYIGGMRLYQQVGQLRYEDDVSSEDKYEAEKLVAEMADIYENTESMIARAQNIIDNFLRAEYKNDEGGDYTDLTSVPLAYTTTEDEKHEIQVNADLENSLIITNIDGIPVRKEDFGNLFDFTENVLRNLDFDELVSVSPEELKPFYEKTDVTFPLWENKKEAKTIYEAHPEISTDKKINFDLRNNPVDEAGKKERCKRNIEAIKVLKKCESEGRLADASEQLILSKYVGWGGIPEAFDESNVAWNSEHIELQILLSEDEYASARESTLTAFYTPPAVIDSIYKVIENMGFSEGNILEPACGTGNFIGMLPENMKNSKICGVELDSISAKIAQQLYQKNPIAADAFEKVNLPDSFFDVVVGNVPFGDFKVSDKKYDKFNFLIHDYFFAKSLDKLRPGGVMALVTSKGTMDKANPSVRKYIAQRADLLGAIRLPDNTFKGNAGTEVVSDILILQKRDRIIDIEPDWVHLDKNADGFTLNSYFVNHPEMILGELKEVSGRFGPEVTVTAYENSSLKSELDEAISNIHGEIESFEIEDDDRTEENFIPADPNVRNFSYTVIDGSIYYRENSKMTLKEVSSTAKSRIKGMILIRDSVRHLIELQTENYPDEDINKEQGNLNRIYDAYTEKYGLINGRANRSVFSDDSSYSLLSALEVVDEDGNLEKKADMFFKRTIKPHVPVTEVDTASEAYALSMGEKACVDMDYMCELTGKTEDEIYEDLKGIIFLNPLFGEGVAEDKYLPSDEYLSGNVREKLIMAKKTALSDPDNFTINVEALEKVQPKDLSAGEIAVRLGATWVPADVVERFVYEFLDTPRYAQWNIKVHFSKYNGEWNIEGKSYDRANVKAYSTYGTGRINAYKIIEETLNLRDVRIFDYVEDEEGRKKAVLNKKETAIAQSKQELIKQGFNDWIWKEPERRERLCKLYNEKFNSLRPRQYDGRCIEFSGMNPEIELREHQKNAVAHILYGGNTLLAHCVGAGKTFEMTAAAMESKRLGLCSKSLFVVPNHLTEQWASEFLQLYPSANILVATKKDFETKNRKRFCGRIATGDYDAIIIGHSQFEKIPMSLERQRLILQEQLDEVIEGISDLKRNRGDNFSVKQMEKTKKTLKTKLDKLNDQSRKDDVVTFEELGVDRIFIDESHYYKNLFLYTKMRNVGGIAQTEAQKSSDLFMKCRYLDELTGGRGTVFATGTPISNSMVELYTIQRYLQYNTLQKYGLQHFDAWASTFGETVTAVELTPEGTGYRAKTRFAKFYNLPELMSMFKEVADIKTPDMLHLPVPNAHYHNVAVKPSQIQKDLVASLSDRADKVRNGMVDSTVDNMLLITNDGRKLALDQRLTNDMLPDFEGSKVNACVENIYNIWQDTTSKKSAQLVFCDLSTPKNDGTFSVYDDIRKKLIERGIPAEEVKFIHEADTEAKKQDLFKKVRRGEIRVLMGSTFKMGAGTNCQDRLIALHDIDCPWV